jgi:hypothetical protein
MAGLVPDIHVWIAARKAWMPGTSPGMTVRECEAKGVPSALDRPGSEDRFSKRTS